MYDYVLINPQRETVVCSLRWQRSTGKCKVLGYWPALFFSNARGIWPDFQGPAGVGKGEVNGHVEDFFISCTCSGDVRGRGLGVVIAVAAHEAVWVGVAPAGADLVPSELDVHLKGSPVGEAGAALRAAEHVQQPWKIFSRGLKAHAHPAIAAHIHSKDRRSSKSSARRACLSKCRSSSCCASSAVFTAHLHGSATC